jgi:hypothetical protein
MPILGNRFLHDCWQISESREIIPSSCFVYYEFPFCLLADSVIVYPNLNKGISAVQDASSQCFYMFTLFKHGISFVFNFPASGRLDVVSYHILYYLLSCVGLWNERSRFGFWRGQGICCLSPCQWRFSRYQAPVWGVQDNLSSKDKSARM